MNSDEFQQAIDNAKIPPQAYSTSDADGWDIYGIGHRTNGWELYYSERGERSTIRFYDTESEAFDALYRQLIAGYSRVFPETEQHEGVTFRLLRCTACHRRLRVPQRDSALRIRCPDCRAVFILH